MATPEQVPYGKRLMVVQVDHLAKTSPEKIYASFPKSVDFSEGFRDVTYKELANAINRAAAWLKATLGGSSTTFETVAYIGEGDIRYFILILASHKTGHKLLLPSPRNSLEGQINLIDKTECHTILVSKSVNIDEILNQRQLKSFVVPSLDEILDPTPVAHIPYERTFEQAHAEPYAVYHSSGTTGLPKPIVSPQDAPCSVDAFQTVPLLDGRENFYTNFAKLCPRHFSGLPFFHVAGLILGMCQPVYYGNTVVFGHPDRPTNSGVVDDIIDHGHIDGFFLPPSILEEMTKTESSLDRLSRIKMVFIAAGPLSTPAGRLASQKTFLAIGIGSTESFVPLQYTPDPEDWQYFMINGAVAGIDMRPDPDRTMFELVYQRRPECEHLQAIFKTFRDLDEFSTGDLFTPHPTKPHLWHCVGRQDDLIVLANGEKVQPGPISDTLSGHKAIRTALVVGRGRFQIAAILELREYPKSDEEARKLMDDIWPMVEEVNRFSPAHGRLLRPFITFASPDRPFVRVGKGTVSVPSTMSLYAEDIEALYVKAESDIAIDVEPFDIESEAAVQKSLQRIWDKAVGKELRDLDQDFFSTGADSLAVLTLAATMKKTFHAQMPDKADQITVRLIYTHPTIRRLSSAITDVIYGASDEDFSSNDNKDVVENLIERATRGPWLEEMTNGVSIPNETAILLTGSTGSLGSYILDALIADKNISKVYCFNRAENGEMRQKSMNQERGLATNFDKAVFLKGDLSLENFGLKPELYQGMAKEVGCIIHAQWPVDFNLSITTFEPHIQGTANLAAFASRASLHPTICFLSSIASVENWTKINEAELEVPEQSLPDTTLASSGYGLSKLTASTILDQAAEQGVRSLVLRIGQIAGPRERGVKGIWPKQEWLPSLIASSKYLGLIPESLNGAETVDWIPVDDVAQIVCELATATDATGYAHIVSPQTTTWKDKILPAVQEHYQDGMKVVSLSEWVAALQQSAREIKAIEVSRNPAIKLLDFYQRLEEGKSLPCLATHRAQELSQSMREHQSVSKSAMLRWLASWNF